MARVAGQRPFKPALRKREWNQSPSPRRKVTRARAVGGDFRGSSASHNSALQQLGHARFPGAVHGLHDAFASRVGQRCYAALDALVFDAGIAEDRLHVGEAEAVELAREP